MKAKTELILSRRKRKIGQKTMLIYRKRIIGSGDKYDLGVCIENTNENGLGCVHCSNFNLL